jgi:outer membrane protein assembly factor BamB
VIALDSASGAQKWEYRMGDKVVMDHGTFAADPSVFPIAASDQALYGEMTTTRDSKKSGLRFALRAQDGKPLWQKNEETAYTIGVDKGFVVDGVLVVVKDSDVNVRQGLEDRGYVAGYDAASGKLLWSKQLDGPLDGPSSLFGPMYDTKVVKGVIYVSTHLTDRGQGNSIYAFSVKDGAQLWHYQDTNTSGSSYPTVTENGVYFNRYAGQTLVALDTASGKIRWTYNFHDNLTVEYPPAADNDQVYLSLPNNIIQILRASDGKPISSFKVGGKVDPNNRVLLQVIE